MFVELASRIVRHRQAIDAALDHGLSQGLIESTNTKIRLLTRIAFGFRSPEALIALDHARPRRPPPRPARPDQDTHGSVSRALFGHDQFRDWGPAYFEPAAPVRRRPRVDELVA